MADTGNGRNGNGRTGWQAAVEFGTHIVVAALVFVVIALVAFGLRWFMVTASGWTAAPPAWMLLTLELVEDGLFVFDVLIFVVYVLMTGWHFLKSLFGKD